MQSFLSLSFILMAIRAHSAPLILITESTGTNFFSFNQPLPYWKGTIAYYYNEQIGFGFTCSYYSYAAPLKYATISTTYSVQEIPTGLLVDYRILDFSGFIITAKPEVRLLFSTDDELYQLCDVIPLEWIESRIQNRCYFSVSPGVGVNYNLPKTNLWLGLALHFNHHFGYNKKENDYLTLTYSIGFELFRR